jgi:hypothetical protein
MTARMTRPMTFSPLDPVVDAAISDGITPVSLPEG